MLCDLEIWQMTLKNNRAPLLCYFKLWASFSSHLWIQTGVTVRRCTIWLKSSNFFFVLYDLEIWQMTLKTNRAPLLYMPHQALCLIQSPYVNSNWSYSPETLKLGFDLCDLDLWPLTLTFCMDITFVNGNYPWKFHEDTMIRTLSTRPTLERQ